jgi:hypothetical protein
LDRHPQLEEVLIGIAPPFKKLRNPVLRGSVAKVTSLRHAAAVARIPVLDLVNRLRAEVGQSPLASEGENDEEPYFTPRPDWCDEGRVVSTIDERDLADDDGMPLAKVAQQAARLGPGEILLLTTTFLPAPGIDIMREKGFLAWPVEEEDAGVVMTHFMKPAGPCD